MKFSRLFALIGMLGIAILLAFPLRQAVYVSVIVPLAYGLWFLGLVYRSVDQVIWWLLSLLIVLALFSKSLLPQFRVRQHVPVKTRPKTGRVEDLSVWIKKTERGVYFKWLVANRLGKVAHQILARRDTNRGRSVLDPLSGPDWAPKESVRAYLEAGLHGSFADYPQKNRFFARPTETPMDREIDGVIEYLETQVED